MVLVLKRLRKEKYVGVVPFAKHQKTCEKEMCQSYTICKTPDNVWPWVKTNHPPPQKGSLALVKPDYNGTKKFRSFRLKAGKREYLERYYFFCRKISTGMNRFI